MVASGEESVKMCCYMHIADEERRDRAMEMEMPATHTTARSRPHITAGPEAVRDAALPRLASVSLGHER